MANNMMVVVNLNQKNEADQRVFPASCQKSSNSLRSLAQATRFLGAIESGVDFEKRIVDIYQHCRRPEEINAPLTSFNG
jgi:adenine-specific DNA-methyltransferase